MNKLTDIQVKEIRVKLGLSQEDLAKKIGVSRNTIINYEKGGVIPDSKKELLNSILMGEGSMLKEDSNSTTIRGNYNNVGHGNKVGFLGESTVSYAKNEDEVKFLRLEIESLKREIEAKNTTIQELKYVIDTLKSLR